MKRLVYSPSVKAWVKTDFGVIDLSPYITHCDIQRKIDDVSKLRIAFRNPRVNDNGKPRFMFTEKVRDDGSIGPVFHPMDPITVSMERIAGKPIQVFTGYCDTVPYVQLFPGTGTITASCTLKRLQHTYWDPSLPFVQEFLRAYGWFLGGDGTVKNPGTLEVPAEEKRLAKLIESGNYKAIGNISLNDGSIGNLLYAVLNEIGGWDSSNIYIQSLPDNLSSVVAKLMSEFTEENKKLNQEITEFFHTLVGSGDFGTAAASGVNGNANAQSNSGVDANSVPKGGAVFEGTTVASWIKPILDWARQHGWNGSITSGYRTPQHNADIGGAANSNHTKLDYPGGAIDVGDPRAQTEGQALYNVIKNYPNKPTLVWAKDAGVGWGGSPIDWGHFSSDGH
jgi:hypothetical protein